MGLVIFAIVLIFLDQASKYFARKFLAGGRVIDLIPGFFRLHYVENRGAAWGVLSDRSWGPLFLQILTIILTIFLIYWLSHLRDRNLKWFFVMIIAGSIGNLIDRFLFGFVTDFISFQFGKYYFPVFNFADSFIVIGVILLIFYVLFFNQEAIHELYEVFESKAEKNKDVVGKQD